MVLGCRFIGAGHPSVSHQRFRSASQIGNTFPSLSSGHCLHKGRKPNPIFQLSSPYGISKTKWRASNDRCVSSTLCNAPASSRTTTDRFGTTSSSDGCTIKTVISLKSADARHTVFDRILYCLFILFICLLSLTSCYRKLCVSVLTILVSIRFQQYFTTRILNSRSNSSSPTTLRV